MLTDDFSQLRKEILDWRHTRAAFQNGLAQEARNRHAEVSRLLQATADDLAVARRAWRGEIRGSIAKSRRRGKH